MNATIEPQRYVVEQAETGAEIDSFATYDEALEYAHEMYQDDIADDCFEDNYYAIRDMATDELTIV